jgi:hydroxyethylthiazole kinase
MNTHAMRLPTGPMLRPWEKLAKLRDIAPLVHNITNYVVMNNTANALLAIGASPAMVHAVEEVEEFTGISGALVINIGTLSPRWVEAMYLAVARAAAGGIPWVLDPVGAGATRYRTDVAATLVQMRPTVVRGNASEIMVLAGVSGVAAKGVDSAHGGTEALDAARRLASRSGAIVAMTGEVDYVTDGERVVELRNGHPLMARVTGLGCTASALVGAFLATGGDAMESTVAAISALGVAGEIAAEGAAGPGTLQLRLLDTLYSLDEATLTQWARITEAHASFSDA